MKNIKQSDKSVILCINLIFILYFILNNEYLLYKIIVLNIV